MYILSVDAKVDELVKARISGRPDLVVATEELMGAAFSPELQAVALQRDMALDGAPFHDFDLEYSAESEFYEVLPEEGDYVILVEEALKRNAHPWGVVAIVDQDPQVGMFNGERYVKVNATPLRPGSKSRVVSPEGCILIPSDRLFSLITLGEDNPGLAMKHILELIPAELKPNVVQEHNVKLNTKINLSLPGDITEEDKKLGVGMHLYALSKDSPSWLVASFIYVAKDGRRIKGELKRIRGKYVMEVFNEHLSLKEFHALRAVLLRRVAENL